MTITKTLKIFLTSNILTVPFLHTETLAIILKYMMYKFGGIIGSTRQSGYLVLISSRLCNYAPSCLHSKIAMWMELPVMWREDNNWILVEIYITETRGWAPVALPVILATQEAEIRRITVRSQPGANRLEDPILKKHFTKRGWWCGSRFRPWVQTSVLQRKK
jgi:hypothetical protein